MKLFPLLWLCISLPFYFVVLILFYQRRHVAPVNERNVPLVMVYGISAFLYTLGINFYYGLEDAPCYIGYITSWVFLSACAFAFMSRCWIYYFRYMMTQERLATGEEADGEKQHVKTGSTAFTSLTSIRTSYSANGTEMKHMDGRRDTGSKKNMPIAPHTRSQSASIGGKGGEKKTRSSSYVKDSDKAFFSMQESYYWFNNHRYAMGTSYVIQRLVALEVCITIAMFIVLLMTDKINAIYAPNDPDSHCVSDVPGLTTAYFAFLGLITCMVVGFAWILRKCNDGFNVKTEMKICVFFALLGSAVYAYKGAEYPFQPLDGNAMCLILFCVSTVWPLYRSYFHPPPTVMPKELGSVTKLVSFPEGFESFKEHLITEFSVENILFWQEVERYKHFCAEVDSKKLGPQVRHRRCKQIYGKYIKSGSLLEVNISSECKRAITGIMKKAASGKQPDLMLCTETLFNPAQQEILDLLQADSYPRYIASGRWKVLKYGDEVL